MTKVSDVSGMTTQPSWNHRFFAAKCDTIRRRDEFTVKAVEERWNLDSDSLLS